MENKETPIIRNLQENDFRNGFLETLENLSSLGGLMPSEAQKIFLNYLNLYPHIYKIFVAELNKKIVGSTTLLVEQKFIHNGGKVGHIEDVATRKGYERLGIGRALIEHAISVASRSGCYKVILDCGEHNVIFYEKLGFHTAELCMRSDL